MGQKDNEENEFKNDVLSSSYVQCATIAPWLRIDAAILNAAVQALYYYLMLVWQSQILSETRVGFFGARISVYPSVRVGSALLYPVSVLKT